MDKQEKEYLKPQIPRVSNIPPDIEETRDHYSKSVISISHLLGMISSNVVDYIRSAFEKDYFKTIWNSMEEPFVNRSKSFRDAMSKPNPSLYIMPNFDPSDEPGFVPQSEFDYQIANTPDSEVKIGMWNSSEIARYSNFRLFAKPRRYKMTFNMKCIFDSDIQRIQAQEYMRQSIRHKAHIVLHKYLENVIPTSYMKAIADINNMDYKSEEFLKFINTFSSVPITRRLRTGSGNMEFFAMVRSPIEIMFRDAPVTEGPVRKGNLVVNSAFSDNCTVEFVSYSVYFLVTNKDPGKVLYHRDNTNSDNGDGSFDTVGVDKLFLTEYPNTSYLNNNCIKIVSLAVQPDHNGTDKVNVLHDGLITNDELIRAFHESFDEDKEIDYIHPLVFEGIDELGEERINFNRKNLDLEIKDMDIYSTYYIYFYLDRNKVNKTIYDLFVPDDYEKLKDKEDNING